MQIILLFIDKKFLYFFFVLKAVIQYQRNISNFTNLVC